MNSVVLGWFLPVLARKADSMGRFRPSGPTARSASRICESEARSSFISPTSGWIRAMSRKVSASSAWAPLASSGQAMP